MRQLLKLRPQLAHQNRLESVIHSIRRELPASQNLCFSFMCFTGVFRESLSLVTSSRKEGSQYYTCCDHREPVRHQARTKRSVRERSEQPPLEAAGGQVLKQQVEGWWVNLEPQVAEEETFAAEATLRATTTVTSNAPVTLVLATACPPRPLHVSNQLESWDYSSLPSALGSDI